MESQLVVNCCIMMETIIMSALLSKSSNCSKVLNCASLLIGYLLHYIHFYIDNEVENDVPITTRKEVFNAFLQPLFKIFMDTVLMYDPHSGSSFINHSRKQQPNKQKTFKCIAVIFDSHTLDN